VRAQPLRGTPRWTAAPMGGSRGHRRHHLSRLEVGRQHLRGGARSRSTRCSRATWTTARPASLLYSGNGTSTPTYAFQREGFRFSESSPTARAWPCPPSRPHPRPDPGLDSNERGRLHWPATPVRWRPRTRFRTQARPAQSRSPSVDPLTQKTSVPERQAGAGADLRRRATATSATSRDANAGTFEKSQSPPPSQLRHRRDRPLTATGGGQPRANADGSPRHPAPPAA
jgi:hypothetical protein